MVQHSDQILANFNVRSLVIKFGGFLINNPTRFFLRVLESLLFTLSLCTSKRNLAWPSLQPPTRLPMIAVKFPLSFLQSEQTQLSASPSMPYVSASNYLGGPPLDLLSSAELAPVSQHLSSTGEPRSGQINTKQNKSVQNCLARVHEV